MSDINLEEQQRSIYWEELEKDNEAFEAYLQNIYTRDVPRPIPPSTSDISFWRLAGLESSLFVLSAIGAALLSAIRTGGLFWLLEELLFEKFGLNQDWEFLGSVLGFGSMVFALMAFEGFLLGYGLTRGRESGKMEVSKTGLVVSLLTVISAGIFSSFSIVQVSDGWQMLMNILLALITGGASALVAFYSSENLGFILNNVSAKRNEKLSQHQDADKKWRESARESYTSSYYNIRHKRSDRVYGGGIANSQNLRPQPQQEVKPEKKKKSEIAYDYVEQYYRESSQLPTNKTVNENTGVSIGTSHDAINRFITDNAEELLSKGIVTQEHLVKITGNPADRNPNEILQSFINSNSRFPSAEELSNMEVSLREAAVYVSENADVLLNSGLVDERTIEQARAML